jgi:hypothetical protein
MSIDFSQLIEATFFSVWEAFDKIKQEGSMEFKNISVGMSFALDISQNKKEPMAILRRYDSCSMGLRKQNDKVSCELTLNLKRRVV